MSSNKRRILRNIFTGANAGCGCGCGKPKLSDIFEPEPKPKAKTKISNDQNPKMYQSSSSSWDKGGEDHTSTTFSLNLDTSPQCSEPETINLHSKKMVSSCPKISDSLAVVKDSNDPHLDFRGSMLQMILERDIYSKDDLQELLNCFLQLNSPIHHEIIVQAFMEIWNGVISSTSPQDPSQ